MKVPCRNCESRSPTCHAECEIYLSFRKEWEQRVTAEKLGSQAIEYEMTRCKQGRIKQALRQKNLGRKYVR